MEGLGPGIVDPKRPVRLETTGENFQTAIVPVFRFLGLAYLPFRSGYAVFPEPLVETVRLNPKPACYLGHWMATLGYLLDRFNLEFFCVSLTAHNTSL